MRDISCWMCNIYFGGKSRYEVGAGRSSPRRLGLVAPVAVNRIGYGIMLGGHWPRYTCGLAADSLYP